MYEKESGQVINISKSGIFFSSNVAPNLQVVFSSILEVQSPLNTFRYLGMPSLVERQNKVVFSYLKDRLWQKFHKWKHKPISKAGKEVLIKAVAQSIPTFIMSVFLLLVSLIEELERMMNSFYCGSKKTGRGSLNWVSLEMLCSGKDIGRLGFRNLKMFNLV